MFCRGVSAVLAALALASPAAGARGLLVGVDDDLPKWNPYPTLTAHAVHDLGLGAIRVTIPWRTGVYRPGRIADIEVRRALRAAGRARVVLAVYGPAGSAPRSGPARVRYCGFVRRLLARYPRVHDVVIWNEPNSPAFWRPQFAVDGTSAAAPAYEALLARCWDVLHAALEHVNVIAASAPHGDDDPASPRPSESPVQWYRALGDAYRSSGRTQPIFDTVGHNPYPNTSAERPSTLHDGTTIGEGDYHRLLATLIEGFGGTGQPLPGFHGVSIWYMEDGFQTTIDPLHASSYVGVENDRFALPPWSPRFLAVESGQAPDQATQLADAVELAYCQPEVGAFFNFELADETRLAGWQSGVLWADGTPKPSYRAFKEVVARVRAGRVDCTSRLG
jgi:hypothetical protein